MFIPPDLKHRIEDMDPRFDAHFATDDSTTTTPCPQCDQRNAVRATVCESCGAELGSARSGRESLVRRLLRRFGIR